MERLRRRGTGPAPIGVSGRIGGAGIWEVLGFFIAPDFREVLARG
ncbi:hypothetical protein [Streptomyces sp. NPDC057579]